MKRRSAVRREAWLVTAVALVVASCAVPPPDATPSPVASTPDAGLTPAAAWTGPPVARASSVYYSAGGPSVGGCSILPADNPWNTRVDGLAVHAKSAAWVTSMGGSARLHPDFGTFWEGAPIGIPFTTVTGSQARVPVTFDYADESDPGPYPIPATAPIEGGASAGGDRHVLVVETGSCTLYELYAAYPHGGGTSWTAGSGAVFDLSSNALRPDGWTSADAAGLPILPGLVRYDEVQAGRIDHAIRFTAALTQRGYIAPATHFASSSSDANRPPMGARFRLKSSYDCSWMSHDANVVCLALKQYGMLLADNGSNWYISGEHNPAWDDDALGDLKQIPGSAFEAVQTGPITTG